MSNTALRSSKQKSSGSLKRIRYTYVPDCTMVNLYSLSMFRIFVKKNEQLEHNENSDTQKGSVTIIWK
jgi:hypothetical protein